MKCPVCRGRRYIYSALYGKKTCPKCLGKGYIIKNKIKI